MKNKKYLLISLIILVCVCFFTCENNIVKEWWEPEDSESLGKFTVIFLTNGGSPDVPDQVLSAGQLIKKPEGVKKAKNTEQTEWYELEGWVNSEGEIWDFKNDKMPDKNIILSAKWDSHVSVTFVPNNGEDDIIQFYYTGELIDPPVVTQYGYIFNGWFTVPDLKFEFNFNLPVSNEDLSLYAGWLDDLTFFTVTYDTNGGTPQPQDIKVAFGDSISTLPFITRAGFGFGGWEDTGGLLWESSRPVTSNDVNSEGVLVLKARWVDTGKYESGTDDFYIVVFDSGGGTPQPKPVKLAYSVPVGRLLPMTRANYGFVGWFDEDDNLWDIENDSAASKSDVNSDGILFLTAKWETRAPEIIEVSFDPNSTYSDTPITKQLIAKNSLAVQPIMPKPRFSGYGFAGWYNNSSFTGDPWDFNEAVQNTMTLYAKWEPDFRIVRFEPMGGMRPDEQTTLTHEFAISKSYGIVPDPGPIVKPGYSFGGWFLDPSYSGTPWDFTDFTHSKTTVLAGDEDLVLYAYWGAKERGVIWDPNGGDYNDKYPLVESYSVGSKLNNPAGTVGSIPVRTGYTFRGWFFDPTCAAGTGLRIMDYTVPEPDGISEQDAIYLYAGWMTSRYYVTFNIVGSSGPVTGKVAEEYVDHGGLANKPIIEPASGRFLDGKWYKDTGCTIEWNFDSDTVTSNTNLYAEYDSGGHTVTFVLRNPPGGTSGFTVPEVQHVAVNGKAVEPYMPPLSAPPLGVNETRYSFYRWDTSPDGGNTFTGQYNFDTPVTSDLTLYARWVPPVPDMVWVPRGSFIMGDAGVSGSPAAYHAYPTRRVTLDGFYISRFEITQEDGPPLTQVGTGYNQIMGPPFPSQFTGTRTRPVENVSWQDAMNYCDTRSTRDNLTKPSYNNLTKSWQGDGYRLPTEAEWEYAAKGGYYWQDNLTYAGSDDASSVAWFNVTVKEQPIGFQTTQTVGLKTPNKLGIYDMSGNLSEWCYDWFTPYNTLTDQTINPIGGSGPYSNVNATGRVRRGGAWNNAIGNVRVAVRNSEDPAAAHWAVGFRIVRGPSAIY